MDDLLSQLRGDVEAVKHRVHPWRPGVFTIDGDEVVGHTCGPVGVYLHRGRWLVADIERAVPIAARTKFREAKQVADMVRAGFDAAASVTL